MRTPLHSTSFVHPAYAGRAPTIASAAGIAASIARRIRCQSLVIMIPVYSLVERLNAVADLLQVVRARLLRNLVRRLGELEMLLWVADNSTMWR